MKTLVKRGFVIVATLMLLSTGVLAQAYLKDPKYGPDEEARKACATHISLYRENYNQRNFAMAKSSWLKVLEICPAASQNAYIHGARMMKTWIDEERNLTRKNQLIDSLMMLYDMRIEYFDRRGILLGQKGMDMVSLDPDRYAEAYNILKESISIEKDASESSVIFTYMAVTKTMFDNNKISPDEVIETYVELADYLDAQIKAKPDDDRLVQVKENVEALFTSTNVANCTNLPEIFGPRIESNPQDQELIKKTFALLSANRCDGTDFYRNVAVMLFKNEPTSMLAWDIAKIFSGLKDFTKSEEYYKHAIELETDPVRKSVFLVEYANIMFNEFKNPQQARSLALQAIAVNPNIGHAFILIGNIYASEKNCFTDEFQRKTVFWAAVDKFQRAKQVDPSLASDCDRLIDIYTQYFPQQSEIFFQDLQPNQRYTVGCWINEVTTVRARP